MNWKNYELTDWIKYKVSKKIIHNNKQILLLEVDKKAFPPEAGRKNLICVDGKSEILWVADLPKNSLYDGFTFIEMLKRKLFATTSNGFKCEVDLQSGKILSHELVRFS